MSRLDEPAPSQRGEDLNVEPAPSQRGEDLNVEPAPSQRGEDLNVDEPAPSHPGEDVDKGLDDLETCRIRIDEIDLRLLELLNQRTSVVEEIGRIKQHLSLAIYEPKREEQVFANVTSHNQGPLPHDAIKRIFERIIDEMRTVQKLKMFERNQRS